MTDVEHLNEKVEWNEETLYLNQFEGLIDSIYQAAKEPLSEAVLLRDVDI